MLHIRDFTGAPRQFFTPGAANPKLCGMCREEFSKWDLSTLNVEPNEQTKARMERNVRAKDLYRNMKEGCPWCVILGNSVLTAARKTYANYGKSNFEDDIPWYREQVWKGEREPSRQWVERGIGFLSDLQGSEEESGEDERARDILGHVQYDEGDEWEDEDDDEWEDEEDDEGPEKGDEEKWDSARESGADEYGFPHLDHDVFNGRDKFQFEDAGQPQSSASELGWGGSMSSEEEDEARLSEDDVYSDDVFSDDMENDDLVQLNHPGDNPEPVDDDNSETAEDTSDNSSSATDYRPPADFDAYLVEEAEMRRLGQQINFETLNCDAVIRLVTHLAQSQYSDGWEMMVLHIQARPTETCAQPWLFLCDNDAMLKFDTKGEDGGVFASSWKILDPMKETWHLAARNWITRCRQAHGCPRTATFRPTRLIELREGTNPRLVLSSSLPPPADPADQETQYLALSYVWGKAQTYILTLSTLDTKLYDGLEVERLPQTVRDALTATAKLGFRYLWVDALCIIQDSGSDKLHELPMMEQIYYASALTLVARSARSAEEGFLNPCVPWEFLVKPFTLTIGATTDKPEGEKVSLGVINQQPTATNSIDTRCWTLQEWYLSSCRLVFTDRGIQWCCARATVNPALRYGYELTSPAAYREVYGRAVVNKRPGITHHITSEQERQYTAEEGEGVEVTDEEIGEVGELKQRELASQWIEIRAEYAKRSITVATDRLPAISAVAVAVAKLTKKTYVAGLWLEDLIEDLRWYCEFDPDDTDDAEQDGAQIIRSGEKARGVEKYVAPSWSWASIPSPGPNIGGWSLFPLGEASRDCSAPWECQMVNYGVELAEGSDFAFGAIRSAFLKLQGRMLDVEWTIWPAEHESKEEKTGDHSHSEAEDDSASTENSSAISSEFGGAYQKDWPAARNKLAIFDTPPRPDGAQLGKGHLDFSPSRLHPCARIQCMILTKMCDEDDDSPGEMPYTGLLLLENDDGTFRRVGLCRLHLRNFRKLADMRDITIL